MNTTIIHKTAGNKAKAVIVENEDKSRTAHITFQSGQKLHVPTHHINLRAMKANDAIEAVNKVCHGTGRMALYTVTEVSGSKALTRCFSSVHKGKETGYGVLIQRGRKAQTFALSRVNLAAMKAKSVAAALRKAAFTGRLRLATHQG
jgi:hypothetical protein